MNYTLKHQRDLVALEAFSVADLGALVRRVFPSIEGNLKSFLNVFDTQLAVGIFGNKQNDFLRQLEGHRYTNMMGLTAYVPEGLACTYLEYEVVLTQAVHHASVVTQVLNDYAFFLSALVTDRNAVLETVSHRKQFTELQKSREEILTALGKCFTKGSTKTEAKLSDVVSRNADWKVLFTATDAMSGLINKIERKQLAKKVEECVELLERVRVKIERNEFDKASPEVIMDLSDGAYQLASELEFYTTVYYKVQAFCVALERTIEHVKKIGSVNPDKKGAAKIPVTA